MSNFFGRLNEIEKQVKSDIDSATTAVERTAIVDSLETYVLAHIPASSEVANFITDHRAYIDNLAAKA